MDQLTSRASGRAIRIAWASAPAPELLSDLLGEPVTIGHSCPACGSDQHGRPIVRTGDGSRPALSVAHASAMTLVAVAEGGRVGVDIESVEALAPAGVRSAGDPPDLSDLELWVLKEAYLKATGDGLRRNPATVGLVGSEAEWGRVAIDGYVAAWCVLRSPEAAWGV